MIDQAQTLRTLAARANGRSRVDAILHEDAGPKNGRKCMTIAVASGKGGVGKTNISINLALLLARLNKKVILFDADLGLANVNILLGVNPAFTLLDVVEGRAQLADLLIPGPGNISIVPAGSGIEKLANLDSGSLARIIRGLAGLETACDYLIIDTQAGISHAVRAFTAAAARQIVVATPEPSSLADAYAAIKMIQGAGGTDVNIIANMVKNETDGQETYNKLAMLSKRFLNRTPSFLGALPYDRQVGAAVLRQSPAVLSYPESAFVRSLARIAMKVVGSSMERKEGFFDRLIKLFRRENEV